MTIQYAPREGYPTDTGVDVLTPKKMPSIAIVRNVGEYDRNRDHELKHEYFKKLKAEKQKGTLTGVVIDLEHSCQENIEDILRVLMKFCFVHEIPDKVVGMDKHPYMKIGDREVGIPEKLRDYLVDERKDYKSIDDAVHSFLDPKWEKKED